jgi:predicted membrane protein
MHRAGNLWWGLVLIALGVLFLLDNMNVIEFGEAIRTYWPALLILWGVSVLLRRSSRSAASAGGSEEAAAPAAEAHEVFSDRDERPDTEHINYSSVFGDVSLHLVSTHFQGGTVSTVFGDTTIDLSAVTLADGESTLKVSGVFGNMRRRPMRSPPIRCLAALRQAGRRGMDSPLC